MATTLPAASRMASSDLIEDFLLLWILLAVGVGAVALNALGYGLGYLVGRSASRPERIASVLSVGTRDFAVAAALVVAAGLPAIATLPAVVFGVVEMTTSAGLVRWFTAVQS